MTNQGQRIGPIGPSRPNTSNNGPQEEDSYLDYLIKKQKLYSAGPSRPQHANQGNLHSQYERKSLDIRGLYQKRYNEYQPQSKHSIGPMKPDFLDPNNPKFLSRNKLLGGRNSAVGTPTTSNTAYNNDYGDDDSDSDSEDSFIEKCKDVDFGSLNIPLTHETSFQGHSKTVVSCTIDRAGCRMVTSGNDNYVKFWDFPNMTTSKRPFRSLDPIPGQPPKSVGFNGSGSLLLVSGGNAKPKIITRDGRVEFEFIKGDMYIRDHKHIKGHIGVVTASEWHPLHPSYVVTASLDSTVRIWDVTAKKIGIEQQLPTMTVIKCRKKNGTKTGVWKSKVSHDGRKILVACQDGSYQIFNAKNNYCRPEARCDTPYTTEITSLDFFGDDMKFVSRGQDNTMRLFDLRKFDRPAYTWYELENNHEQTSAIVSPDQKYILTGTSNTKVRPGCLVVVDASTCEEITRLPLVEDGKVTCINWNEKLNQIFVGAGSQLKAFFSLSLSNKGVLSTLRNKEREWKPEDFEYKRPVLTPHALPLFNKDDVHKRKNMERIRITEAKQLSLRPELPLNGPGKGGKVAGSTTFVQHIMQKVHGINKNNREDAKEAVLRFAKEAAENPEYVNHAYRFTQPKPILDYTSEVHDEQKMMSKNQKCPKCGMKMCHCMKKP